ncbi:TetR/AcrR family transcriptional regulator [Nocardia cyriacigeorgica]|uniref:TetR/AcrR family transcriptional regulator n=1 Tax=Nocardia cyriacigeorgica TaxID=135487 RepID=UPI0013D27725|nr:TetR/AcrR family transcriptional regulator [Nocardia cyriacigeorgica]NEW27708.1 helix-turn-helix transcriptional regulator [Nocardia cyriacigeorgica]
MSRPVKRPYRATKRAEAAAATRSAIRQAATELFVERGYVATTMREVARRAEIGERTLYDAFPTKLALFRHALDVATVGDEEPVAVAERPEVQTALAESDPIAAVGMIVDYTAGLLERAGDLIMVGVDAASADPELKSGADAGAAATRAFWAAFVRSLAEHGSLRPDIDPDTAADSLFALASPHVFRLLRRESGWPATKYRNWLASAVTAHLLTP